MNFSDEPGRSRCLHVLSLVFVLWLSGLGGMEAETFFTTNATWKMFKGFSEASSPDAAAWRQIAFNDAAWADAPAPFFYSTAATEPPFFTGGTFNGTTLTDMQFGYSCLFLRKTFVVSNAVNLVQLNLTAASDDGFIAWINGMPVARENVLTDDVPFNDVAQMSPMEPVPLVTYTITNTPGLLVNGTNVLAVQAFNRALDSSDFGFMAGLNTVVDDVPPSVVALNPPADATVRSLTQIQVLFNEAVVNLDAADLLINGTPATGLSVSAPDKY